MTKELKPKDPSSTTPFNLPSTGVGGVYRNGFTSCFSKQPTHKVAKKRKTNTCLGKEIINFNFGANGKRRTVKGARYTVHGDKIVYHLPFAVYRVPFTLYH